MATVQKTIPNGLQPEVEATLAWFNRRENVAFETAGENLSEVIAGVGFSPEAVPASKTREIL